MKPEQGCDQPRWSAPEYVTLESIVVVEHGRLPIDEAVVKDIMATISGGDVSALPPVHLWRKQPGGNPFLVAGRNRLEAHKRCGRELISAQQRWLRDNRERLHFPFKLVEVRKMEFETVA
jgi:hypothetical protein